MGNLKQLQNIIKKSLQIREHRRIKSLHHFSISSNVKKSFNIICARTVSFFCAKKYFNCDLEIFCLRRKIVYVCVVKYGNRAVEVLWLLLNALCAE